MKYACMPCNPVCLQHSRIIGLDVDQSSFALCAVRNKFAYSSLYLHTRICACMLCTLTRTLVLTIQPNSACFPSLPNPETESAPMWHTILAGAGQQVSNQNPQHSFPAGLCSDCYNTRIYRPPLPGVSPLAYINTLCIFRQDMASRKRNRPPTSCLESNRGSESAQRWWH